MKQYTLITNADKFQIHESETNQIIKEYSDYKEARKNWKRLIGGTGFQGWTPSFFLKSFSFKFKSEEAA